MGEKKGTRAVLSRLVRAAPEAKKGGQIARRREARRKKEDRRRAGKEEKGDGEGKVEDEGTLSYKLLGDDSIAYRPLGSPEEVFHVLLRYTILYEERSYEGVQVTNTPNYVSLN